MRILMISDVYFPRVNGVSTSIKTFRNKLTEQGHQVTLIAPEYGPYDTVDDLMIRIPSRYLPMDPEDRLMKKKLIKQLEPELRRQQFDIIHVQTPFLAHYVGVWLSGRLGIPVVETYHTYFEEYLYHYLPWLPRGFMKSAARWFTRRQCNAVDALVVPSRAMLDVLREYGVHRPIEIIPTGVEERYLAWPGKTEFRETHDIDADRPVLVHIGRVAHEKNIDFVLDVLAQVVKEQADVLLVIAGEGPALKHLKQRSRAMGLGNNTRFVGYLDRDSTLMECYLAGNAFVFASRTETQGLVLLEAMALGVPVVSTAVMGTRDILESGKGALVAEDNVEDFAAKVLRLLADRELQHRLGREAKGYAATWSSDEMARKMTGIYQQLIEERQESAA